MRSVTYNVHHNHAGGAHQHPPKSFNVFQNLALPQTSIPHVPSPASRRRCPVAARATQGQCLVGPHICARVAVATMPMVYAAVKREKQQKKVGCPRSIPGGPGQFQKKNDVYRSRFGQFFIIKSLYFKPGNFRKSPEDMQQKILKIWL